MKVLGKGEIWREPALIPAVDFFPPASWSRITCISKPVDLRQETKVFRQNEGRAFHLLLLSKIGGTE